MNSMISCSRLLTAALCAAVLAGCNAVEDVPDEPSAALPTQTVVLGGSIKGLGSARPLILQLNGKDVCLVPVSSNDPTGRRVVSECRFLGIADQEFSGFSFGALPNSVLPDFKLGDSYNVTVKRQPYGKICTIQNPTGTLSVGEEEIQITCVNDPAVARYTVTANIAAAASKPGLKVILTTENGTCPVEVNGRSSVTFSPDQCADSAITGYHQNATYVFNNGTSLPNFRWRVTATIPGATAVAPPTNCYVTGGPVTNTGGNVGDDGTADAANRPTGNVAVTVQSCGFAVRVQADYSRPPGVSTDPAVSGNGILVALRSQPWGVDVASARISSFANTFIPFMVPDADGNPTATAYEAQSDPAAFYEVVVKSSPAGMACMPGSSLNSGSAANSTTRTVGSATDAGAILLRRPSSAAVQYNWLLDRVIRCRLTASNTAPLRGVYWQYTKTTTTTTVGTNAPTIAPVTVMNRNVLAFFADGQYLYANHTSTAANNGMEQGFYNYNPATSEIRFDGFTDTNAGNGLHTSGSTGSPVPRTVTAVAKSSGTPGTITFRVSNSTTTGYTLAADSLAVAINNGLVVSVAAATYTTTAALVSAINTAANPGGGATFVIAAASGNEIRITGPAGGVVLSGTAAATLGLPTSVAQGQTATSTNVLSNVGRTVNTVVDWILPEVGPDPMVTTTNPMDGAWVTWDWQRQPAPVEDPRRIFIYQHGLYTAFHVGVNGIANLQEACYVGTFALSGTWTRQGARSGCNMRQYTLRGDETLQQILQSYPATCSSTVVLTPFASTCTLLSSAPSDIPNYSTTLPDYPGRWPQSQNPDFTDGRPYSLIDYEIRPANSMPSDPVCPTVDKLTVWDTQNGVRKDTLAPAIPRIVLCRVTAN